MTDSEESKEGTDAKAPATRRPIDGRREFEQAIRDALAMVAKQGSREMYWCDADYRDWPLGERLLMPHLEAWAYSHRRLSMLACHYDAVAKQHPRWVNWRRQWSHVVDCRLLPPEVEPALCPSLLLAPGVVTVRLFDPVRHRGAMTTGSEVDERDALATLDALLQRSEPGFAATTLGL